MCLSFDRYLCLSSLYLSSHVPLISLSLSLFLAVFLPQLSLTVSQSLLLGNSQHSVCKTQNNDRPRFDELFFFATGKYNRTMGADLVKDVEEALIETAKEVVCSDVYSLILTNWLFFIILSLHILTHFRTCFYINFVWYNFDVCVCVCVCVCNFWIQKNRKSMSYFHTYAPTSTRSYLQLGWKTKEIYWKRVSKFEASLSCHKGWRG